MMYGLIKGEKVKAEPGLKSTCPGCNQELIAKCGEIVSWHWSHKSLIECDDWYEPETEWHLSWKRLVKPENCEVKIGNHFADIVGNYKKVIELQHSPISPETIREREQHYKNMLWVIDGTDICKNFQFWSVGGNISFKWKWLRKSWLFATKDIFIDFPDGTLLKIEKLNESGNYCKGYFIPKKHFFLAYFKKVLTKEILKVIKDDGKKRG